MNTEGTQPGEDTDYRTVVYQMDQGGTTSLHRRAAQTQPALLMVQGSSPGRIFRLAPGISIVGRDPACEISLNERAASRRHAELRVEDHATILADRDSTNGVFLGSSRINEPVRLRPGHLIKIGSTVFKYLDNLLDIETLETLHTRGSTDQLTGTWNKAHLLKTLATAVELTRSGPPLSLLALDLDHFKKVNDTHGHLAGDHVLKETARIMKALIRPEDVLARFGGEEFFIILPGSSLETAAAIAERIRAAIAAHAYEFSGITIPVTASLGVCPLTPAHPTAETLIARADELLYRSKHEGRNRVTVASA